MTDPAFQISIDRAGLELAPLVLKNDRTTSLTLTWYREPAMQARIKYAPSSAHVHGDVALAWAWQQTILPFGVAARGAATEDAARAAVSELVAAITQMQYDVTVTPAAGATPEVWRCDPGSVTPEGDRTYVDLRDHDPGWSIAIPCYPVRS